MTTTTKSKLLQQCTHYLKARTDKVPPFIMEGAYAFTEKIEESDIGLKSDIYLLALANGGKKFIKGQRKNGELIFSEIRSGSAVVTLRMEIQSIYRLKLVSDMEVQIPSHLRPLHDQIA